MSLNINKSIVLFLIISMSFNSASFAMNIHDAAEAGDLGAVCRFLQAGVPVDARHGSLRTPLHQVALNGHVDVAQLLLQRGAEVNTQAESGFTSLHFAAKEGHVAVGRLLVQHKANIDAQTSNSQVTPLHCAALNNHADFARFLLANRANVHVVCAERGTPLHYAAVNGHFVVAGVLLEHGADVNARDIVGKTPLDYAEKYHHHDNVAQLLRDWSLYKAYMRRQALAFAMVTHPRLGEHSPAHVLDSDLRRAIASRMTSASHTLEEIHHMAEQEMRERGNRWLFGLNRHWLEAGGVAAVVVGIVRGDRLIDLLTGQ